MPEQTLCHSCGSEGANNPAQSIRNASFCTDCYTEQFTSCESCGCELNYNRDRIEEYECSDFCETCFADQFCHCEDCGEQVDRAEVLSNDCGDDVCQSCFNRNYSSCEDCGRVCHSDSIFRGLCDSCGRASEWSDSGFHEPDTSFDEIRSRRRFGVELETSACPNHEEIRESTCFGCKEDGSVDGMEFVSPVLYGDAGLEAVENICRLAREKDFRVNSACGMHVHFDLSDEPEQNLFKVALAFHFTYDVWIRFVSDSRSCNYYCAKHEYEHADCINYSTFEDFIHRATYNERYRWINWYAYRQHGTVESRLHSATLNATKITNWIKAHVRFIDGVIGMSIADITRAFSGRDAYDKFQEMAKLWDDPELTQFYKERAQQFHKPIVREHLVEA